MGSFEPTPQQRRAMEDRGGSLLVSAAAGSGKTKVLVERLFGYMERERCRIDDFLIITFTKAAAAELRGRIAAELSQRVARQPENMHLRRQMMRVYQADIKTVDAFCGSLLRENIHLLPPEGQRSLTPDFRVLDQQEAELLRMQVLEQVLEEFYQRIGRGDTQAQQLAETLGAGRDDRALERLVLDIHGKIQSHAYPMRWLERLREQWQQVPESVGPYREVLTDSILRRTRCWARKLTETAAWMEQYPDLYRGYGDRFLEMAEQLQGYETAAQEGWDAMARLKPSFRRMGVVKGCDGAKEQAQAVRKRCKDELDEIGALLAVSESEQLEDLEAMAPAMLALVQLTEDFTAAYQAEKVRRNCMDFSDQEHYAIRLLQGDDGAPTPLGRQLSGRYREIMVDEYQDTNEVQNCIFRAISRDGQNLFTVGDVKQSIYRFRLADPTIFLEKYLAYRPAEEAEEGQPRKVLLSQNFRSRRQVLSAANFVFGSIMSRQMGEMDYGPEERLNYGAAGYPERSDTDTEFHLISVADTEEERFDRTEVEARFVAHRIRQLLDEGFPVQGEDGQQRPVQPEDIVILMRSPAARRKAFTAALQREDIPCAGGEEQSFFETMEIAVMVSFLQIVDNPRQDVPLLAVLRSPLLGFSPDRLAQIRGGHPGGDYYGALCADDGEDSRAFLERLAQLRAAAGELTADRLLWKLYTDWQALAVFGAMEGGAQRRSNLLALYAYAGQLAAAGRGNLFDFVSYLHDLMESGDLPDISARQESGGVQLMTIHKSKGLEFPVVILADLQKGFNRDDFQRPVLVHPRLGLGTERVDRRRRIRYDTVSKQAIQLALSRESLAEEMRILYVAMTRAKEKLICVDCMRFARNRVRGLLSVAGCPAAPEAVGSAKAPGDWILLPLLCTPEAAVLRQWADMEPEQPALSDGGWQVRLWENPVFECGSAAAAPEEAAVQERRYDLSAMELRYGHTAACTIPTKVTATQLKGRVLDEEIAEGAASARPRRLDFQRPLFLQQERRLTAAERGTAMHLVMQYLELDGPDPEEQVRQLTERRLLTPQQAEAVDTERIRAFLATPLAQEIRQARQVWREYRFALLMPAALYDPAAEGEELMLQGVVDCAFRTKEGLVVVDFKTDRLAPGEEPQRAEEYRPQLEAYAQALERVMEEKVCRKVLYFFSTGATINL